MERPVASQEDRVEVESSPDTDDECSDAEPERMTHDNDTMPDMEAELPAEPASPERQDRLDEVIEKL